MKYERSRPEREAQRAEAKLRQQRGEMVLQEAKESAPLRKEQMELELQQTRSELRKMQAANLKTATFNAFRSYEADGEVKHLNNFLTEAKKSQAGTNMYGDVLRLDTLVRSPESEVLLRAQGYTNIDELFADPDQMRNLVMSTEADGSQEIVDMTELYAGTGYTQHMNQLEMENLTKRAVLQKALRGQESAETSLIAKIAKEDGVSTYEATRRYYAIKGSNKVLGSKVERVADDIMKENPELSRTAAIKQATQVTEQRTAGMKDVDASDTLRVELDEAGFFEADLSDPKNRRQFGPKITAIEKLADTKLTTEDKRTVRNLRSLVALGGTAGSELTAEETGLMDRLLSDAKQYMTDDIEGKEGVAAYETFRNVFRNALYGASLTATEVSAFNKAAGNLKQQTGPVLQKLLVQVEDVKTQLESVYQMNDEYVATYYMGKSLEEVDQVIEALDERVQFFEDLTRESDMTVPGAAKPKRSLEEIFGQ